ncbi:hypothetical protein [Pseudomonas sp.]|uniref:hypothetical protein n=1 Tax=Pseudomonas sp. TaxID=306 RepID=UPI0028A0B871|nr:hypothetical protein [Pseudomonas sp.]
MITLAKTRRRVVVPWAPIKGNIPLARDAPDWMDAMAINSRPIGNNVVAMLRGVVLMIRQGSCGGRDAHYSAQVARFVASTLCRVIFDVRR